MIDIGVKLKVDGIAVAEDKHSQEQPTAHKPSNLEGEPPSTERICLVEYLDRFHRFSLARLDKSVP